VLTDVVNVPSGFATVRLRGVVWSVTSTAACARCAATFADSNAACTGLASARTPTASAGAAGGASAAASACPSAPLKDPASAPVCAPGASACASNSAADAASACRRTAEASWVTDRPAVDAGPAGAADATTGVDTTTPATTATVTTGTTTARLPVRHTRAHARGIDTTTPTRTREHQPHDDAAINNGSVLNAPDQAARRKPRSTPRATTTTVTETP